MVENYKGLNYKRPEVYLLNESGLGVAEIAARTCYDSFDNSENDCIKYFEPESLNKIGGGNTDIINGIDNSELLTSLAWVHHHHSIIEHTTLQFLIKGTSRGVLQEHSRHRLQAISVRSTRYTMGDIINAFVASLALGDLDGEVWFSDRILELDMFVTADENYNRLETSSMYKRLLYHYLTVGREEFFGLTLTKENQENFTKIEDADELLEALSKGKKKRNVGDAFKHIVSDNWKVDLVVSFNLRALKNYFDLRDSGAAWFQIRWLAEEMKKVTPTKYLKLVDKKYKDVK